MKKLSSFLVLSIVSLGSMCLLNTASSAEDDPAILSAIQSSDDYSIYSEQFIKITKKLIDNGTCSKNDLVEYGGWVKSQNQKSEPVYFIYCGGMTAANKIYYNVKTDSLK